ncbi:MAG TPA: RNA polymerase sigma factor [Kofleriaceae bacterium]|nr:RNA polymerase sigma factor [Kofleriaceae bacterium]
MPARSLRTTRIRRGSASSDAGAIGAAGDAGAREAIGSIDAAASDAALVERARTGDRWAAEALYRRHAGDALRLAMFLLGRRSDAEDAVQDAFVAALGKLSSLREPAAFPRWLSRIVANAANGRLRRRRLLGWLGLDGGDHDVTLERHAAPGITADQRAELVWLDVALRAMPDRERIPWLLRHVEGWELLDIARILDISLATVKRRLQAAQDRLTARISGPLDLLGDAEGQP